MNLYTRINFSLSFSTFQAAVRSSRRKRNQYVVDLRDTVYELKRRRHEAKTQNELLKQLSGLWERLCSEVEAEIQDGVRQQLNFNIPSFEEALTNRLVNLLVQSFTTRWSLPKVS